MKHKEIVRLREKNLANGNISLYLDIYVNGKREYDFLRLYLIDAKTPKEREANKNTMLLAETIKAKRLIEVQNNMHGISTSRMNENFLVYFDKLVKQRMNQSSNGNYQNWLSCYKYLLKFTKSESFTFKDINENFVMEFKNFLLFGKESRGDKKLAQNSALSYFNKLKASLQQAFEEKIINENPAKRIKGIKQAETKREFLTLEELQTLVQTECEFPMLKKAFLFSALTGLRWSDIAKLKWSEIHKMNNGGWSISFQQKKTQNYEVLPISEQAYEFLGMPGEPNDKIFKGLKYSAWFNLKLSQWIMKAKINKNITFHCARHTHATLLISNGTDIYTVSKLLGHRELKTTQIYAKLVDDKKIEAVNNMPKLKF